MEYAYYSSPVGWVIITAERNAITGLWFEEAKNAPSLPRRFDGEQQPSEIITAAFQWLDSYFAGEMPSINLLPVNLDGTAFQLLVWEELRKIPYGHTVTYGQLAKSIADRLCVNRMSAQAIGGAVGRNPVSVIVPCHRVVGTQGKMTGYAGGIEKKVWLLQHEGVSGPGSD